MFKYSKTDIFPVMAAVLHCGLMLTGVLCFDRLPWWALVGLGLAVGYLHLMNVNSFGHHFIHTPFFKSEWLNRAFSMMNSFSLGNPQELYRVVHLRHHAANNDLPDAWGRPTKDWHSIYRFGRDGKAENVFTYAILTHLRMDPIEICQVLLKQGRFWRMVAEWVGMGVVLAACALVSWKGVVFFYLPVLIIAWPFSYAQNYYEHFGAVPGDRHADAVSAYGRLYNLLWFNNGYHQEHHYQPNVHWTEMAAVREKYGKVFEEHGLRVLHHPHLLGFLEPAPVREHAAGPGAAVEVVATAPEGAGNG